MLIEPLDVRLVDKSKLTVEIWNSSTTSCETCRPAPIVPMALMLAPSTVTRVYPTRGTV